MKKRMSKAARETFKEMAKEDCTKGCSHPFHQGIQVIPPPHIHHRMSCPECMNQFMLGWQDHAKTEPIPEKEIVYRTSWVHWIVLLLWGLTLSGWFGTGRYYLNHPIEKPYPVYHTIYVPDQTCQPKLIDCQADFHAQRATIKVLARDLKQCKAGELP